MPLWEVKNEGKIVKGLKNLKGNAAVMNSFIRLMEEIKYCKDPSILGERKRWKYKHCYGVHLTKSVSFIYRVDYSSHTVYALDIGDHKWLYGRDNRS